MAVKRPVIAGRKLGLDGFGRLRIAPRLVVMARSSGGGAAPGVRGGADVVTGRSGRCCRTRRIVICTMGSSSTTTILATVDPPISANLDQRPFCKGLPNSGMAASRYTQANDPVPRSAAPLAWEPGHASPVVCDGLSKLRDGPHHPLR